MKSVTVSNFFPSICHEVMGADVIRFYQLSYQGVIMEPKKMKSVTVSTFPPSICHEVMRLDAMILVF